MSPVASYRDIFALAWPLGLKAAMLHGIIVIDAYLVSPLGEAALAAMGLAGAIAGMMLGALFAFSSGTQIRLACGFGLDSDLTMKTGFYAGLVQNLVAAAVGLAVVLSFGAQAVTALAQTQWIAEQAQGYLNVMLFVVFSEAVGQCVSSFFNACGKTRVPLVGYLIGLPINVGVSLVLIYGYLGFPELGVQGAAVGTLCGSLARLAFLGLTFARQTGLYRDIAGWAQDSYKASFQRHVAFSWPIAGTFVSMTIANQVFLLIGTNLGVNQFAALTLIMPWVVVLGTFGMAWAQAVGILAAQMLGQGAASDTLDRFISRAFRGAFIAAGIVAVINSGLVLLSGLIYADLQSETKAALWTFLPVLFVLPFPKGSNAICGQTLRAAGDTVYVMNFFIGAQWLVKIPLALLFVLTWDMSVTWVFALMLLDEVVKFPPFHLRFFGGAWKTATDI